MGNRGLTGANAKQRDEQVFEHGHNSYGGPTMNWLCSTSQNTIATFYTDEDRGVEWFRQAE